DLRERIRSAQRIIAPVRDRTRGGRSIGAVTGHGVAPTTPGASVVPNDRHRLQRRLCTESNAVDDDDRVLRETLTRFGALKTQAQRDRSGGRRDGASDTASD